MASNVGSTLERFGERIGKSLLKFLKPVRTAPPHFKEQKAVIQQMTSAEPSAKLIPLEGAKKEPKKVQKIIIRDALKEEIDSLERELKSEVAPDPEKSSWLESVLYMLKSCKKTALKIKRGKAISNYTTSIQSRTASKFESRGTIVNMELGSLQFLVDSKKAK